MKQALHKKWISACFQSAVIALSKQSGIVGLCQVCAKLEHCEMKNLCVKNNGIYIVHSNCRTLVAEEQTALDACCPAYGLARDIWLALVGNRILD